MSKSSLDIGGISSVGDVEFVERLGVGLGSGRFKARLTTTGALVALLLVEGEKYDKPGLIEWARRLKRVDHPGVPGVVQIEDVLEPGFVAQRFIDAQSLTARVSRRGALRVVDALALTLQTAAALRAAHRQDVPHGAVSAQSVRLVSRDGAMDAVRVVGWRPLGPGLTHERGIAKDVRALGELLYFALMGAAVPGEYELDGEPGVPVQVRFGDLADTAVGAGVAQRAVFDALARAGGIYAVDDVVDALLPEFIRFVSEARAEVAYELGADREFKEEVQRQRSRQRELESKLRFIKDWLRDNAGDVDRVDEKVSELEKQERSLRNLEVELAMLLDRPVQPGQTLAQTRRPTAPAPAAPPPVVTAPTPAASPSTPKTDAAEERVSIPMDPDPPGKSGGSGRTALIAVLAAGVAAGGMWFAMRPAEPGPTAPATTSSAGSAGSAGSVGSVAGASTASAGPIAAPKTSAVQTVPTTAPIRPVSTASVPSVSPVSKPKPAPLPPDGMVYIPAGTVRPDLKGKPLEGALAQCRIDTEKFPKTRDARCTPEAFSAEKGEPITVGAFFLDHLEVAQEQYARCVKKGRCKTLKLTWELKTQPATGVTWQMAQDYCAFRGGRLPTADEWLRAARGDDDRLYPWGSTPPVVDGAHKANYGRLERRGPRPSRADGHKYAAPVGVFATRGRSTFHVANLAGNVREWTATKTGQGAIVAGGGWRDLAMDLRTTRREVVRLDQVANDLGFRCVVDLDQR